MVGRPSNRDERFTQVMEALVRCVARYGLDGVSLSMIAKEAGLSRPLIRHHLGNREEIEAALQSYVLQSFSEQNQRLIADLPPKAKSRVLVDHLFSDAAELSPDMVLVFAALTSRASKIATLRQACSALLLGFEDKIAEIIKAEHPEAADENIAIAAHSITALYFNMTSLAPLKMPEVWKQTAKAAANQFLQALETSQ